MERERALVLAAAREVFAADGPTKATIEEIARRAGVNRQSVYEVFGDKSTLFAQVVAEVEELAYRTIAARGAQDADLDLRSWARKNYAELFAFAADNPDAMALLAEAERAGTPALSRLRSRLAEVYAEASRLRWAAHGVDPGRANTALVAMYFAMTETLVGMHWGDDPAEADALIDLLTEFTVGGILRLYNQTPEVVERLR